MAFVVALVIGAGVLMWWTGRGRTPDGARRVVDCDAAGLHLDDTVVPWSSVFDVRVSTRRGLGSTWFGFDVLSEEAGALAVDGGSGRGERFLAETHRLPGFDHRALEAALRQHRSGVVCYQR